ncbi:hypothetical protein Taro_049132 [Colocasia esculenta]|uniref:Secreted protein n=1 Tax=Colocasia esculenta TaxID=4460 RepID=A0A843XA66_COLES|nr:hypothetical protein [Colocasia esculenta]
MALVVAFMLSLFGSLCLHGCRVSCVGQSADVGLGKATASYVVFSYGKLCSARRSYCGALSGDSAFWNGFWRTLTTRTSRGVRKMPFWLPCVGSLPVRLVAEAMFCLSGRTELWEALLGQEELLQSSLERFGILERVLACSHREDVEWSGGDAVSCSVCTFFVKTWSLGNGLPVRLEVEIKFGDEALLGQAKKVSSPTPNPVFTLEQKVLRSWGSFFTTRSTLQSKKITGIAS